MLQIWIHPDIRNAEPNYQQIQCDPKLQPNQLHVIAGPNSDAAMHIRQQAEVKTAFIQATHSLAVKSTQKLNYVHVISGELEIAGETLKAGDALAFAEETEIKALADSQLIWFDLPV
jgi:redox-sensitive bicupin YhaK (pirin superfamily)